MSVRVYLFIYISATHVCSSTTKSSHSGVVTARLPPYVVAALEDRPKCHTRHSYTTLTRWYELVCLQCEDQQRYLVLYYGNTPLQGAKVQSCGYRLMLSVSLVKPRRRERWHHTVMYEMADGSCVQVNYLVDGTVDQVVTCGRKNFPKTELFWGYINGWRKQKKTWDTGVVRNVVDAQNVATDHCTVMRSLREGDSKFTVDCLVCDEEFVAMIYRESVKMAAATVGSCRSRLLEDSISIVPRDKEQPSHHRVQYDLQTSRCVMRGYVKVEGENKYNIGPETGCLYRHLWSIPNSLRGYKNSWKKVNSKPTGPLHGRSPS